MSEGQIKAGVCGETVRVLVRNRLGTRGRTVPVKPKLTRPISESRDQTAIRIKIHFKN